MSNTLHSALSLLRRRVSLHDFAARHKRKQPRKRPFLLFFSPLSLSPPGPQRLKRLIRTRTRIHTHTQIQQQVTPHTPQWVFVCQRPCCAQPASTSATAAAAAVFTPTYSLPCIHRSFFGRSRPTLPPFSHTQAHTSSFLVSSRLFLLPSLFLSPSLSRLTQFLFLCVIDSLNLSVFSCTFYLRVCVRAHALPLPLSQTRTAVCHACVCVLRVTAKAVFSFFLLFW